MHTDCFAYNCHTLDSKPNVWIRNIILKVQRDFFEELSYFKLNITSQSFYVYVLIFFLKKEKVGVEKYKQVFIVTIDWKNMPFNKKIFTQVRNYSCCFSCLKISQKITSIKLMFYFSPMKTAELVIITMSEWVRWFIIIKLWSAD